MDEFYCPVCQKMRYFRLVGGNTARNSDGLFRGIQCGHDLQLSEEEIEKWDEEQEAARKENAKEIQQERIRLLKEREDHG